MRDDAGVARTLRGLHGLERLGQGAYLVHLNENCVSGTKLDALLEARGVGNEEVITHELDLLAQTLGELLPAIPVLLVETVLDRDDGILIDELLPVVDHLVARKLTPLALQLGTQAAWEPDFMNRLLDEFGAEKIVLGLDAKGGAVAVAGWVQTTGQRVVDLGKQMQQAGVLRTVFTDVAKDGTLAGPNINAVKEIAAQTGLQIIASGGVTSLQDILALNRIPGVTGVIIGKALYEGKIKLAEAIEMLRVAEKELGGYAD